jgi:uncharacterized protein
MLSAVGIVIVAAVVCAWGALCLLFWQGGWQLLYRPTSTVARTPAAVGLAFDAVGFDTTDTGKALLRGWWIPAAAGAGSDAAAGRYTVLYLHDRVGNLGDCVDKLAAIHAAGVNVLAFDYRGYGKSEFVHPSERHWREDADSALEYLTGTRQIPARSIVVEGSGLGANLALEVAAAHAEIAGVVLDAPMAHPVGAVFDDPRAHLVPAHLLFFDRYRMQEAATALRVPSLWLFTGNAAGDDGPLMRAFGAVTAPKKMVRGASDNETAAFSGWLEALRASGPAAGK